MENDESNLFTWNDAVTIKPDAPVSYFPGKTGVICGMEQIKSEKLSHEFKINIGDWLYTEFRDELGFATITAYDETSVLQRFINFANCGIKLF